MHLVKTFIFGIIIGIANIIPGVSGGTMAVILNIYDKILLALSKENIQKNLKFLLALGAGTLSGILLFSNAITFLFENYFMATNFCFIGLVLGSVPMVFQKARFEKIHRKNWIVFLTALLFMIGLAIIKMMPDAADGLFTAEELPLLPQMVWLFTSAIISTIGMILPGISGSFIMLLLGVYAMTLKAITEFNLMILIPVAAGVGLGGILGVKIVKNLILQHPQAMYLGILGLMTGSLFIIFPGFALDREGMVSLLGLVLCTGISYGFSRINKEDK